MAKLISEKKADEYNDLSQHWLIGNDFEVTIFIDEDSSIFFVDDISKKISSLKFMPQIIKDLNLSEQVDFQVSPSIDACGIKILKVSHDYFFRLLENYLLHLEKNRC